MVFSSRGKKVEMNCKNLWEVANHALPFPSYFLASMLSPRKIALLVTLVLALSTAQAQKTVTKPTAPQPVAGVAAVSANTLLWKISGKGLAQPSYLYGTIHLICPTEMQISESVKQAFSETQQVVMELDMDSPTMAQEMQRDIMMSGGQNLQQLLSAADYAAVGNYLQTKAGLPIEKIGTVKPFILSSMLYPVLLGCTPASYEAAFVKLAQEQKKEVLGLETVDEQLGFFEKIPYGEQSKMLADMVNQEVAAKQELQLMMALYKTQNVEGLRGLMSKSLFGFQKYEDLLLDSRNQRWIAGISQQATAKSTFFALGAAHLGGPKGVLALLRQQGYQIQPVVQ